MTFEGTIQRGGHGRRNDMNDISGPQDVYKCLVEDAPEDWLLGLLAFAVLEEQRID